MLHTLLTFLPVAAVLTVTPGIATALVIRSAVRGGRREALAVTVGNSLGVLAWALFAAIGVAAVDVLPDPRIRQELSAISNWPTIPQLFVNGELVGGCDIVTEMYETGELAEALGVEPPAAAPDEAPPAAEAGAPLSIENRLN